MFDELFSPGRKHTDEERKRLELTRVDLNDGDPGRGPIDLTSGKVVVRVPTQASPEPTAEPEPVPEPASGAGATPKPGPGPDPSHDSAPDLDPTVPSDDQS
ncbi:DUF6191 domain-containing protein [Streptomyces sp. NPDC058686]|uniref:DUF6191 domain-containing protein n=1 Tax=Streptomyces sp. NPDC058686 TaxID=3346599 RepID=UPI00365C0243